MTWKGKHSANGTELRARAIVTILKGCVVALARIGEKRRVITRETVLRDIFSTFGVEDAPKNPRLITSWRQESIYMSGGFSATSILYMMLRTDGTFYRGSRLLASMTHTDNMGSTTGSSTADSGGRSAVSGR